MPKSSKERPAESLSATPPQGAETKSKTRKVSQEARPSTGTPKKPGRRGAGVGNAAPTAPDVSLSVPDEGVSGPVQSSPGAAPARRGRQAGVQAAQPAPTPARSEPQTEVTESETAQPTPRQGRRGKVKTESGVSVPAELTQLEVGSLEAEPPELVSAVPTQRRGRRANAAQPLLEALPLEPLADQIGAAPVLETAAPGSAEAQTETVVEVEVPRPSRRGRKGVQASAEQAAPEPLPAQPEWLVAAASQPGEAPARKGSRRGKAGKAETEPAAELAASLKGAESKGAEPKGEEPLEISDEGEAQQVEASPEPQREHDSEEAQAQRAESPQPAPARGKGRGKRQAAAPQEAEQASVELAPTERPARRGRRAAAPEVQEVAVSDQASSDSAKRLLPQAAQHAEAGDSPAQGEADPARQLVVEQLRRLGRPVHIRDFERSFTRQGREKLGEHKGDLEELLDALVQEGQVIRTRKRTYGLPEAMNLVRGRFQASASGFGFVIPDSGGPDSGGDYYIPEGRTMEAWNGDTVLIRPEGRGGRRGDSPAGVVVRVVTRARTQLVGSLEHSHGYAFLKPDDTRARHRIMLVPEGLEGLPDGARLVTELYWPENTGEDEAYGQVVRVLGNEDDPETETQAVVVKYGLRDEFPPEVVREAEAIPAVIPEAALFGRLDLREYNIFTVDGRDAKDFDDAIHIQPTPEGNFVVGVHIADVSHYVKGGHPLDDEAYARATSVYLPGRVLPMLPEHLSNGVCSLVPDQDRLTVSALIELNIDGDILDVKLAPSVIRSKARLTYDEVQAYSEAVATLPDFARNLEGDLHLLLKITSKLRQRRLREGSLDFKMREVRVDVGKDGHMELVPVREETARGMIEDLMLLANKVVAKYLIERNVPALFRIHEEPTLARFQEVSGAIGRLGLAFPGNEPTPQAYQAVLKKVRGTGQETAVNTLLLRSMQQAKYAGENLGHFGLAFGEYLHFTSPIRRYPDLLVHRVLKASLLNELSERDKAELHAQLSEMGRHTSERERTASEAERDLTKYYQAKWAQENLGEVFEGYVSGVIASGLFVALENGVEGRIHISNLEDDYYHYIEDAGILKGRSSGRVFRIGERIGIRITQVSPLARQIEFTQETSMDQSDSRPRARRREDRETTKRDKLSTLAPSAGARRADAPQTPAAQTGAAPAEAVPAGAAPARVTQEEQQAASGGGRERGGDLRLTRGGQQPGRPRQAAAAAPAQRGSGNASQGGGNAGAGPGGKRRIVTLDRPRNEHLRPVNVTVQRMYFGDWTLDNMPPEEAQGGGNYRSSSSGTSFRGGRSQQNSFRSPERPAGGRTQGSQQGRSTENRAPRPQVQAAPAVSAPAPSGSADDGSDASKRRRRRRGRRGGNGSATG